MGQIPWNPGPEIPTLHSSGGAGPEPPCSQALTLPEVGYCASPSQSPGSPCSVLEKPCLSYHPTEIPPQSGPTPELPGDEPHPRHEH